MPNKVSNYLYKTPDNKKQNILKEHNSKKKNLYNANNRKLDIRKNRMKEKIHQRQLRNENEKNENSYKTPVKSSKQNSIMSPKTPLKDILVNQNISKESILSYFFTVLFPDSINEMTNEPLHNDEVKDIFIILSNSLKYYNDWNKCIFLFYYIVTYDSCFDEFLNDKFIYCIINDLKYEFSIDLSPRLKVILAMDKHLENIRDSILKVLYSVTLDYINNQDKDACESEDNYNLEDGNSLLYVGLFKYYVEIIRNEIEEEEEKLIKTGDKKYIKPVVPIISDEYREYISKLLRQSYVFLKSYDIVIKNYRFFLEAIQTLCRIHPYITPLFLTKMYEYWPIWNPQKEQIFISILSTILVIYSRPVTYHVHYKTAFKKIFSKIADIIQGTHVYL